MKKLITREKMSKKARREMDLARRNIWGMSPITRVKKSGKVYNRASVKSACRLAL